MNERCVAVERFLVCVLMSGMHSIMCFAWIQNVLLAPCLVGYELWVDLSRVEGEGLRSAPPDLGPRSF